MSLQAKLTAIEWGMVSNKHQTQPRLIAPTKPLHITSLNFNISEAQKDKRVQWYLLVYASGTKRLSERSKYWTWNSATSKGFWWVISDREKEFRDDWLMRGWIVSKCLSQQETLLLVAHAVHHLQRAVISNRSCKIELGGRGSAMVQFRLQLCYMPQALLSRLQFRGFVETINCWLTSSAKLCPPARREFCSQDFAVYSLLQLKSKREWLDGKVQKIKRLTWKKRLLMCEHIWNKSMLLKLTILSIWIHKKGRLWMSKHQGHECSPRAFTKTAAPERK